MSKVPRRPVKAPSSIEQETARESKAGMSSVETAQYIVEFTAELSYLARQTRLDLLAYLLDMARLEAIRAVQANSKER